MLPFLADDLVQNTPIELTLQEIHLLAYFYHWGMEECYSLPCTKRGIFVDKIRLQLKAEQANVGSPLPSHK